MATLLKVDETTVYKTYGLTGKTYGLTGKTNDKRSELVEPFICISNSSLVEYVEACCDDDEEDIFMTMQDALQLANDLIEKIYHKVGEYIDDCANDNDLEVDHS